MITALSFFFVVVVCESMSESAPRKTKYRHDTTLVHKGPAVLLRWN